MVKGYLLPEKHYAQYNGLGLQASNNPRLIGPNMKLELAKRVFTMNRLASSSHRNDNAKDKNPQ